MVFIFLSTMESRGLPTIGWNNFPSDRCRASCRIAPLASEIESSIVMFHSSLVAHGVHDGFSHVLR